MSLKIEQYYLDLKKVSKIKSDSERSQIHRYYQDLMHAAYDGRQQMALSLMLTLLSSGYLIDSRNEKIEHLLS
jgi:hypothetical protein